ncbi:helix-turn-helix transcriptional regulator [Vagococcus sp. DIV0080]|uniref:Helix-turn-helix transcriptional regulator n=1 Tax=Candidatus Vagococcus giribetii TaxID=2230876 RepID=A0ABS3HTX0_9ENTE|nr:helix-turn-helix transcriptional regulator [Vagococcus sp. DIV0080]MBO0477150.1 helix-turn-helix transcriptional regulator [Vagococcus sp. DIV0080]
MDIGTKIKSLRQTNNLTQQDLAEKINVSAQSISNWERGKDYPDIGNIIHLSDFFKVSLDVLIKEDIEFKEALINNKVDHQVYSFFNLMLLLVFVLILGLSIYTIVISGFDQKTLFGLVVGSFGVIDFGMKVYRKKAASAS